MGNEVVIGFVHIHWVSNLEKVVRSTYFLEKFADYNCNYASIIRITISHICHEMQVVSMYRSVGLIKPDDFQCI